MGLKADFISEVFSALRGDVTHMEFVRKHLTSSGDRRDATAVERLATALLKLYFPDLRVTAEEFERVCLAPAIALRMRIREQLGYIDPGSFAGKPMAQVRVNVAAFDD
jgi:ATP-dependent Lon protease